MSVYVVMSVYMPYMSLCFEYIVDIVPRFKNICAFAHFHYAHLPIINDDDDDWSGYDQGCTARAVAVAAGVGTFCH